MAKFRAGEWARIRNKMTAYEAKVCRGVGGKECEIVAVLPGLRPPSRLNPAPGQWYEVRTRDGWEGYVEERLLEKLTGSWDEIERLTGWRPGKSKQREREAA